MYKRQEQILYKNNPAISISVKKQKNRKVDLLLCVMIQFCLKVNLKYKAYHEICVTKYALQSVCQMCLSDICYETFVKRHFSPISASGSNFNPRNIKYIPEVEIFAFLELEHKLPFLKVSLCSRTLAWNLKVKVIVKCL